MFNIGFVGIAGSGKDTSASLAQIELAMNGYILEQYAFAAPLKQFCENVFGLGRHYWYNQDIKESVIRISINKKKFKLKFIEEFTLLVSKYNDLNQEYPLLLSSEYVERMYMIFLDEISVYTPNSIFYKLCRPMSYNKIVLEASPRQLMQTVGTEFFRVRVHNSFWTKIAPKTNTLFTDVRFQNEADHVRENDGILVHVVNEQQYQKSTMNHDSEKNISLIKCDYTLYNDGKSMLNLSNRVSDLISQIEKEKW